MADIFDQRASAEAVVGEVADEWRNEGIEIGEARAIAGLARTMLQQGMEVALIASLTGLSAIEIQTIQAELAAEE